MLEVLEIFAAVMAVFGIYSILDMIRVRLLYPKRVRMLLRGAVFVSTPEEMRAVSEYAAHLRREQKISGERLIILVKDDIIVNNDEIGGYTETVRCTNNKETNNDRQFTD